MKRPIVLSPITCFLGREDAEIALISVEVWPSETIVRLAALVDDPAAEESAYEAAVDQWVQDGRNERTFPAEPDERRFQDVSLALSDDVGTLYHSTCGQSAGLADTSVESGTSPTLCRTKRSSSWLRQQTRSVVGRAQPSFH
jgi:hypothetical protein